MVFEYFLNNGEHINNGKNRNLRTFLNDMLEDVANNTNIEDDVEFDLQNAGYEHDNSFQSVYFSEEGLKWVRGYIEAWLDEENTQRSDNRQYGSWEEQEIKSYYSNQL